MSPPNPAPESAPPAGRRPAVAIGEGQAAEVAFQLGGLARAGLPLPSGLRALAEDLGDRRLGRMLELLAEDLEAGTPLDEALAARGDAFPPHLRGLIVAGARTGRMAELLGEFLAYYRTGDELRRRFWLSLFYPSVLLLLCMLTFAALAAFSANGVLETLADFGVSVPWITLALIGILDAFAEVGVWTLLGPLLVALLAWPLMRVLFSQAERRQFVLAIPMIGGLYRWTALAEFCRALAALAEAELPLPEALPLAARSARDATLEKPATEAASSLAAGLPLADALDRAGRRAFPEGLCQFLRWADGRHGLPEALRISAGIFEARAQAQAGLLGTLVAALAVAVVLWSMAVIFVALVLPMVSLISSLAGIMVPEIVQRAAGRLLA